jgi:hypothetical protein
MSVIRVLAGVAVADVVPPCRGTSGFLVGPPTSYQWKVSPSGTRPAA